MKIGTLAKTVGCHVETVRYYERVGLIPKARRMSNGYGDYSAEHLRCLTLVRQAKNLGFSQCQIRELVKLSTISNDQCSEVHRMTLEQINTIEEKLRTLQKIRHSLSELAETCEANPHNECPALGRLTTNGGQFS